VHALEIAGRKINVKRGLELFIGITALSITLFLIFTGVEMIRYMLSLKPRYLALLISLSLSMWVFSALKFHLLLLGTGERVSFWRSFQAFMSNLFMGAITPSQTGGGIAQMYVLSRGGVPLSKAFIACATGAGLTMLSLFSSALVIIALNHSLLFELGYALRAAFIFAAFFFVFFLSAFALAIAKMDLFKRMVGVGALAIFKGLRLRRRITYTKRILRTLNLFTECVKLYTTTHRHLTVLALLLSYISLAIYCFIASAALYGLGVRHKVLQVFLIQVVLSFIAYFSPSPGASGVAEGGSYLLMAGIIPNPALRGAYTLIWRLFTSYLGVTVGGLIFTHAVNVQPKPKRSG